MPGTLVPWSLDWSLSQVWVWHVPRLPGLVWDHFCFACFADGAFSHVRTGDNEKVNGTAPEWQRTSKLAIFCLKETQNTFGVTRCKETSDLGHILCVCVWRGRVVSIHLPAMYGQTYRCLSFYYLKEIFLDLNF